MTLPPGSTIGILGAGQLGKMLAEAATKLGFKTHIYAPDSDPIAASTSTNFTAANYTDMQSLLRFSDSVDVITLEFENVPVIPLKALKTSVYPSPSILEISQHRLREKEFARQLGIDTAPFCKVSTREELQRAFNNFKAGPQSPLIVKTATLGYDGKGQQKFKNVSEIEVTHESEILNSTPNGAFVQELIAEGFVQFTKEISVIVARNAQGEIQCFEPVENVHKNHILHTTTAPANITPKVANRAIEIATLIANKLNLIGLLAIELFVTADEKVIFNEMAPRPHNSGHWTIEGCTVSQFEQAIRAVTGMELLTPQRKAPNVVMTNLIGDDVLTLDAWRKTGAHITVYGKKETRPGRKMGHVTELKS